MNNQERAEKIAKMLETVPPTTCMMIDEIIKKNEALEKENKELNK